MRKGRIINRIRRFRFEKNEMTQQDLADKVAVTRQTIIALEAQKYTPSLHLAFLIARVFNASVEDIFTFEE
jgi:putative transcriptional regulator